MVFIRRHRMILATHGILQSGGVSIDPVITAGLQLYWDAGNTGSYTGSGTSILDLSGNSRTGTLFNGVGFNSGNGGYLTFDGINDYVRATIPNYTDWTVQFWWYSNDIASKAVFYCLGTTGTATGFQFGGSAIGATWGYFNGGALFGSAAIATGAWYNLAVTKLTTGATSTYKLYTNGVLTHTQVAAGSVTLTEINLGRRGDNFGVANGRVPICLVYNTVLTDANILTNYNVHIGRF